MARQHVLLVELFLFASLGRLQRGVLDVEVALATGLVVRAAAIRDDLRTVVALGLHQTMRPPPSGSPLPGSSTDAGLPYFAMSDLPSVESAVSS